ncbi:mitochondrial S-adenosylmethionine carrier protein isoform 4-T4 [Callospermophilus lateralis]
MPVKHMLAASAGEVVACLIRVPSEVVKQRAQVSASSRTFQIFSDILYEEGIQGLYRGYKSTVLRENCWLQLPLCLEGLTSSLVCHFWLKCHRVRHLRGLSVLLDSFLFGPVSLVGILKSPLVLAAGACGGFLAVSSLWSFCRWLCSCSHHPSGCGKDKNHVGKGWFQRSRWQRAFCPAWGLAVTGASRVICGCLPSDGLHQPGRVHLSGCLRPDPLPAVASGQREFLADTTREEAGARNLC